MKIIVLSFQGAFLQAESAQSHLTKHFEYFLVKCVPQQSRALNFKEGVLIIETSFIAKHLSVYKLFQQIVSTNCRLFHGDINFLGTCLQILNLNLN